LRALGRSSDLERLGRVAQKLEGALAGAAPQPSAAGGSGSPVGKWVMIGVLTAGGAAGFWGWRMERERLQRVAAAHRPAAAGLTRTDESETPTVSASVARAAASVAGSEGAAADGGGGEQRFGDGPRRPTLAVQHESDGMKTARRTAHGLRPARASFASSWNATDISPTAANTANATDLTPSSASSTKHDPPRTLTTPNEPAPTPAVLTGGREANATSPLPTSPALHERSHSQPPPAAASRAGGERSEAALLLAARKAQPTAALELLVEHATRFPDGLLAPERDVLRIEALRKLGRTAEAESQLRVFEARYPESLHLRRLVATQLD
jgi:hypothetical protein